MYDEYVRHLRYSSCLQTKWVLNVESWCRNDSTANGPMEVSTSSNWTYQNDCTRMYYCQVCVSTQSPHMKTLISQWHRKWKYLEKERSHLYVCLRGNNINSEIDLLSHGIDAAKSSHVLHHLFSSFLFFHFHFFFSIVIEDVRTYLEVTFLRMCVCELCTLCRCHRQDFPFQFPMSERASDQMYMFVYCFHNDLNSRLSRFGSSV